MKKMKFYLCFIFASILFSCSSSDNWGDITPPEPNPNAPSSINSFGFYNITPEGREIIDGVIDSVKQTITLTYDSWVENPQAITPFFLGESTLYIDGKEIISEKTEVDFTRRDFVCTVKSEDGASTEYTVSLISPQTTGLPVIKIDIDDGIDIDKQHKTKNYYNAAIKVHDYKNPEYSFETETGIRGRGNSTWNLPKKPYRIKFNEKTSMFGLPEEKSWVLLANYIDPSLLMNSVAFELGRRLDMEYTNTDFHVELFVNGSYRGNYQLTEQVQVKNNRINVDKKTGFHIELDVYYDDEFKFRSRILDLPVNVKYPDMKHNSDMMFIEEAISDLEVFMFRNDDFANADLSKHIDIKSVINYMLVNEITRNTEIRHPKSVKAYKKNSESPLQLGPVWDFDWGFGKSSSEGNFIYFKNLEEFMINENHSGRMGQRFFYQFMKNKQFAEQYKALWNKYESEGLFDLTDFITEKEEELKYSQYHNFKKWNNNLRYHEQIDYMKGWLETRVEYLDREIKKMN